MVNILVSFFLVFFCQLFFFSFISLLKKKETKKEVGFVSLLFSVALFFQQGCMLQWVRNSKGRLVSVSIPQGSYSESSLNLDQMEPPQYEFTAHPQYPLTPQPPQQP